MLSKKTTKVLTAIVLVAAVGVAFGVKDLRFWAWSADLRQVAQDSYSAQLYQTAALIITTRQLLVGCQSRGEDCTYLIQQLARLEQEEARLLELKVRYGS